MVFPSCRLKKIFALRSVVCMLFAEVGGRDKAEQDGASVLSTAFAEERCRDKVEPDGVSVLSTAFTSGRTEPIMRLSPLS